VYGGEAPQKHVLHVYEVQTGMVLQQCPMTLEHNECGTLKPRFPGVLCKGHILTGDACSGYLAHAFAEWDVCVRIRSRFSLCWLLGISVLEE
jgi:hypothetical protein